MTTLSNMWKYHFVVCLVVWFLPFAEASDDDDRDPLWMYISIPFVSGLVGWGTNIVALKMTFYPLEFFGINLYRWEDQPIGLFGWQGIIPTKATKMAGTCCDLMLEKLINVKEVFSRIDPKELAKNLEPGMVKMMSTIIEEVAQEQIPSIWEFLPLQVKEEMVVKALEESPTLIIDLMEEVKENIEEVFDLKSMVVEALTENKQLLNDVFEKCGAKEFVFIERSGFLFGFIFGLFQAILWWFYDGAWILPTAGFIVGYLTNYLALKMIFEPVEPTKFCGFTFQGLFLRRQAEVSEEFAAIVSRQILNSDYMWNYMLTGPNVDRFIFLLGKHTARYCDNLAGALKPIVLMYIGTAEFKRMKEHIALRVMSELPNNIHYIHKYSDEALQIETVLRESMQALSPAEFEGVLHPVFQEDELKLIIVGAVLGVAVGFFQLIIVFGGV